MAVPWVVSGSNHRVHRYQDIAFDSPNARARVILRSSVDAGGTRRLSDRRQGAKRGFGRRLGFATFPPQVILGSHYCPRERSLIVIAGTTGTPATGMPAFALWRRPCPTFVQCDPGPNLVDLISLRIGFV